MKVNKNSWHYKVADWAAPYHGPPDNLCAYFWTVAVIAPAIAFGITFVAFLAALIVLAPIVLIFNAYFDFLGYLEIAIFFVLTIGAAFIANEALKTYLIDLKWIKKNKLNQDIKTIDYVVEYARAKKNKYCPHLEFVSGDNNEK